MNTCKLAQVVGIPQSLKDCSAYSVKPLLLN